MYSVLDLFAGCGGFSKGFENAGFEVKGFIEFWKPAIDTHLFNFKNSKLVGKDIYDVNEEDLENYDVIIGGPPCQGFSMAGKRKKDDKRNILWKQYLRIVDIVKPKVCVMENVKGIITMKNEKNERVINEIINEFKIRGYELEVKILNASNYEVPEKRQRVIFIASKGKIIYPKFVGKKSLETVFNLPYEEDDSIQHIYINNLKLMKKSYYLEEGDNISTFGSAGIKLKKTLAPTITKGGTYIHPVFNRIISVREQARIQTFPDDFVFKGNISEMYQQIGNAVPVKMAECIAKCVFEILEDLKNKQ